MHVEYTELMSLMLDNEASPEQVRTVQAHLKTCPNCTATWQQWQSLDARLKAAPMLTPSSELVTGVLNRLEQRHRRRSMVGWLGAGLLASWGVMTGMMLCLLVAGAWWGRANPLQASVVLSASSHLLSSLLWPVRGMGIALASAGLSLEAGIGGLIVVCGLLLALWVVLAARPSVLAQVRVRSH
jgi:predicted anti-sigma-YlaC factor YlaD